VGYGKTNPNPLVHTPMLSYLNVAARWAQSNCVLFWRSTDSTSVSEHVTGVHSGELLQHNVVWPSEIQPQSTMIGPCNASLFWVALAECNWSSQLQGLHGLAPPFLPSSLIYVADVDSCHQPSSLRYCGPVWVLNVLTFISCQNTSISFDYYVIATNYVSIKFLS